MGVPTSSTPHHEPVATNTLERISLPATKFITGLPPAVPIVAVFALVLLGGLLGPWGAFPLGLVVLFLLWMLALSWPRLRQSERLMRIAVIVLVIALTVVKVVPR